MREPKKVIQMFDLETLPLFLQKQRKRLGLTQEQVAEAAGVHKSTYIRYEKGEQAPNLLIASWVLGALGCDMQIIVIHK